MSDLSAVVVFLVCLALTFALVWACEWVRPHDARPGTAASEARR